MTFDPCRVTIFRHRQSVTQGEVEVFYKGELIGRFGDHIHLLEKDELPETGAHLFSGWVGYGDAYWLEVARRHVAKQEAEKAPQMATLLRRLIAEHEAGDCDVQALAQDARKLLGMPRR